MCEGSFAADRPGRLLREHDGDAVPRRRRAGRTRRLRKTSHQRGVLGMRTVKYDPQLLFTGQESCQRLSWAAWGQRPRPWKRTETANQLRRSGSRAISAQWKTAASGEFITLLPWGASNHSQTMGRIVKYRKCQKGLPYEK